jgi:hypothetical protein
MLILMARTLTDKNAFAPFTLTVFIKNATCQMLSLLSRSCHSYMFTMPTWQQVCVMSFTYTVKPINSQLCETRASCDLRTRLLVPNYFFCVRYYYIHPEMRTPLIKGHFSPLMRTALSNMFHCTMCSQEIQWNLWNKVTHGTSQKCQ